MTRSTGGGVRHHATRDLWEGRYIGADGRRHSVYAPTRRAAQERLRAALSAADHGIRPVGQQLTLAAFLEGWLASVVQRRRPRTVESYTDTVRRYIVPEIGRVPLAKLEPVHVARMLVELSQRSPRLSPTTVRYARAVLRIALGQALREGKVVRNVATLVDPPRREHVEHQPLNRDQVRVLLDGIRGDRLEALYVTALGTGLRQGELLALRWSDIDLERRELTVRQTLQRGTRTTAEPKTERSRRTLRLPSQVVAALATRRAEQAIVPMSGLVFTAARGTALDSRNVTRYLQAHLARLGLPRQRFHDLRHAWATLMLEDGEDLAAVSKALGHSTVSTTADVYAHVTPAMLDRVAARMEGILGG